MTQEIKPPTAFWILIGLALVWNLLGVMAFVAQMMMTPEMLAALPQAEQELYASTPTWANVAFAFAVFGGAIGCIALLLRANWAFPALLISLLAVIVQMFHSFFISNSFEVFGPGGLIMPIMVIIIAIVLVWFSHQAKNKTWYC